MDITALYSPKLVLDREMLIKNNGIRPGSSDYTRFSRLADEAELIARPKALVSRSSLTNNPEGVFLIDGSPFSIEGIRGLVKIPAVVFPFIATCGSELNILAEGNHDLTESWWLQNIMEKALDEAVLAGARFAKEASGLHEISIISPGSFPGWKIEEQIKLFALFQGHTEPMGIVLNSGIMMVPGHSLSGIFIPCTEKHDLCALCGSKKCARRKVSPLIYKNNVTES